MGLLLGLLVTAANVDDATAAPKLFERLEGQPMSRVKRIFADNKDYNHALYDCGSEHADWELMIVRRP